MSRAVAAAAAEQFARLRLHLGTFSGGTPEGSGGFGIGKKRQRLPELARGSAGLLSCPSGLKSPSSSKNTNKTATLKQKYS